MRLIGLLLPAMLLAQPDSRPMRVKAIEFLVVTEGEEEALRRRMGFVEGDIVTPADLDGAETIIHLLDPELRMASHVTSGTDGREVQIRIAPSDRGPYSQPSVIRHRVAPVLPPPKPGLPDYVSVTFTIGEDGSVRDLKVSSEIPALVNPVIEAVSQWKYQPATHNGEPFAQKGEASFALAPSMAARPKTAKAK